MSHTTQVPAQRVSVILSRPTDWDEWIEIVKTKAMGNKIWEYVDPSTLKDNLSILNEPTIPRAGDVNPQKPTVDKLDANELEELKLLRYDYKRQIAAYERKDAALGSLRSFIQETISRAYLPYTFKCDTPYDMLTALKTRVAPTDQARKMELIKRYRKLVKAPKSQDIYIWLQEWEKVYTECKELNLPDVDDNRSLFDFLNAISTISPEFANVWIVNIQEREDAGTPLPDLYKIIELYRNNQRLIKVKEPPSYGAFPASYQGKPADPDKPRKSICLCGVEHQFPDCPYLIQSIRPEDWKPDPDIEKQIEEKINNNPRLKTKIKYARIDAAKKQDEEKEKDSKDTDRESLTSIPAKGCF